jgi:4-phytase/acid phosphatase
MSKVTGFLIISLLSCGIAACATHASVAGNAPVGNSDELRLDRVVMLMRHGVRPPTKAKVVPEGMNDQPWPKWSVDYGELTAHGYDAVRLVGAWDRTHWAARGLLPANGCPEQAAVEVAASAKSRTQATARALAEGMAPGCTIDVDFPQDKDDDVEFHPLDAGAMPIDADEALRAVQALAPPGGMQAEVAAHADGFKLLDQALGCTGPRAQSGCSLAAMPPALVRNEGDRPDIGDPFGIASTVSQTFLLEYLEGMPMSDVAWGRLSRQQIEDLLEFHSLKFYYEGRAPYVAARAASPLASRMLQAMKDGPKLTVLVGHDTNIADLGGFLDLHWKVPSYPRDDPPPGGALGFEVLSNASGKQFVRAFYRSQTMDQVRELQPLSAANPPSYEYLPIPGCASLCPLQDFEARVRGKLVAPVR